MGDRSANELYEKLGIGVYVYVKNIRVRLNLNISGHMWIIQCTIHKIGLDVEHGASYRRRFGFVGVCVMYMGTFDL